MKRAFVRELLSLAVFPALIAQVPAVPRITGISNSASGPPAIESGSWVSICGTHGAGDGDHAGAVHEWDSHALVMGGAVKESNLYGTFPTLTQSGPDDSGIRGTRVPSTSNDQCASALANGFGLPQADLDYVFPNLLNFPHQMPEFV